MDQDCYKTLIGSAVAEFKEKGSRFIAFTASVETRAGAEQLIADIRDQYDDATHHCYAYRIHQQTGLIAKSDDDGEPSGTAGRPILHVIESKELTNVLIVVTRYFGGTKLGMGGLMHAYSTAAALVLDSATIITRFHTDSVCIKCTYPQLNPVLKNVEAFHVSIQNAEYGEKVVLKAVIRKRDTRSFIQSIIDQTGGQVRPSMEFV